MREKLESLKIDALSQISQAESLSDLETIRVKYLSKKGELNKSMKLLGSLPPEERKEAGKIVNDTKNAISHSLEEKQESLSGAILEERLLSESLDVTMPSYPILVGSRHPLDQVVETIEDIFIEMGYSIKEGQEVESDYYNFEALNIPKDHPARDMQDSFYLNAETLLRTHTSPVQARTLEESERNEPIRILCPGKVYRRDEDDATHSHQFMQIEALVVDKGISMSDLKGTLEVFVKKFFGEERKIRLRPSYFPFTEPSVEVDVSCAICHGTGCRTCKNTGWIEVLGAGMVHPNVLKAGDYDPNFVSGFAFGIGVERMAMLKYGIDNIRDFYTNDVRFLKQRLGEL